MFARSDASYSRLVTRSGQRLYAVVYYTYDYSCYYHLQSVYRFRRLRLMVIVLL
jgi:hypothetical protein